MLALSAESGIVLDCAPPTERVETPHRGLQDMTSDMLRKLLVAGAAVAALSVAACGKPAEKADEAAAAATDAAATATDAAATADTAATDASAAAATATDAAAAAAAAPAPGDTTTTTVTTEEKK